MGFPNALGKPRSPRHNVKHRLHEISQLADLSDPISFGNDGKYDGR
jgi:hypothetical protein